MRKRVVLTFVCIGKVLKCLVTELRVCIKIELFQLFQIFVDFYHTLIGDFWDPCKIQYLYTFTILHEWNNAIICQLLASTQVYRNEFWTA